jgi:aminoglycoside-2''-adenylyltransferase
MAGDPHALGRWEPWRPGEVAALFTALQAPWWIAGGWAIDLFLGRETREHEDTDVQVLRRDQLAVRALLGGWDVQAALPLPRDEAWPFRPWRLGETLDPAIHDIWCRPSPAEPWALQLMIADSRDDQWLSRRHPAIVRPLDAIGLVSGDGISYLAPEIQLHYKAKGRRPKDEADFARTAPALNAERRQWLTDALALAHPDHPWLDQLRDG